MRRRVLLVANDVVGEKMAAPGIRYAHFARELARDGRFQVSLMVTNDPREVRLDGVEAIGAERSRHRQLRRIARSFDVIVGQGGLDFRSMVFLAGTDVRTIYDLYAPLFEMLTFEATRPDHEAAGRDWDAYALRHRLLLLTARALIGANEQHRHALLGALGALGRIGVNDYRQDPTLHHLVRAVGLGIDDEPPRATVGDVRATFPQARDGDRILVWPGNLWDWFDPDTLMRAMARISSQRDDIKLFCLGLRHPSKGYGEMTTTDRTIRLAEELGVKDRTVFFEFGWIPYHERQNYLLAADLGMNVHGDHVEAAFSYRTRLLDYLWAALPIVTTEGGALSDLVDRHGLGRTIRPADVDGCARAIVELCDDREAHDRARTRIRELQPQLAWRHAVQPLIELIEAPQGAVRDGARARALALRYAVARGRQRLERRRGVTQR